MKIRGKSFATTRNNDKLLRKCLKHEIVLDLLIINDEVFFFASSVATTYRSYDFANLFFRNRKLFHSISFFSFASHRIAFEESNRDPQISATLRFEFIEFVTIVSFV